METHKFEQILSVGENIAVEFKRCGGKPEADTYETICSFLNRFGGDLYLGVENDGTVIGVPQKAAPGIVNSIISMVSNPDTFSPTVYLSPEIMQFRGKTIVHVHVPPSSEVHFFKKIIYDRVADADVKVAATGQIAAMYIRKQSIFTEKKVYPYVTDEDLRFDLLPRIRRMAVNRMKGHLWENMSDAELLKSAGLIGEDKATGDKGYNLAAIMLLGRDEVILSVAPQYRTDALLRRVNTDRYDDRLIVETNLIESYDLLMGFAAKHLLDKFFLEDSISVSLSSNISREMLVNCLMHREFTSSYIAQFVIEKDRMFTTNANRAETGGIITPDNFRPNPKNPIIASFFRNIGLADELGSGVRNIFRYSKLYSGKEPQMIDGDVFRIIVPLDDNYSFDARIGTAMHGSDGSASNPIITGENGQLSPDIAGYRRIPPDNRKKIVLETIRKNGSVTTAQIAPELFLSLRSTRELLREMIAEELVDKKGSARSTNYVLRE